jgi:hypothetical protein
MRYAIFALLILGTMVLGCSKKEIKAETQAELLIEPSGYYWINLMPVIPKEGPSFNTLFKIKVTNGGKTIVKNVKAISAVIYTFSDEEEKKLGTMELEPSPNTPTENSLLPGEEFTLDFGGSFAGATHVTPGLIVYGKVFIVWDGGHATVASLPDNVTATH